jgi:transcriptional regulator with XRE-family HTH domain
MAENNLHSILVKEGLSQSQLASTCGLSSGTVNRIAKQKRTGAPRTNHKILKGIILLTGKEFAYKEVFPSSKEF